MKVYCIHEHERHCGRGLCHRVGLDGNLAEILKDTKHCEVEVSLVSRTCAAHGYRSITPIEGLFLQLPSESGYDGDIVQYSHQYCGAT